MTPPPKAPPSATQDLIAQVRKKHYRIAPDPDLADSTYTCWYCEGEWPCHALQCADALEASEATARRAVGDVERLNDLERWVLEAGRRGFNDVIECDVGDDDVPPAAPIYRVVGDRRPGALRMVHIVGEADNLRSAIDAAHDTTPSPASPHKERT